MTGWLDSLNSFIKIGINKQQKAMLFSNSLIYLLYHVRNTLYMSMYVFVANAALNQRKCWQKEKGHDAAITGSSWKV